MRFDLSLELMDCLQGEGCAGPKAADKTERGVLGFGSKGVLGAPAGLSSLTAALGLLTGDAFRPPLQALPLPLEPRDRDRDRAREDPAGAGAGSRRQPADGCGTARSAWPGMEGAGRGGYGDGAHDERHDERRTGADLGLGLRSTDALGLGLGAYGSGSGSAWRGPDRLTPRGTCGADIGGGLAWGAENVAPGNGGGGTGTDRTTPNKAARPGPGPERNRDRDGRAMCDEGSGSTAHVVRQMAALDLVPRLPLHLGTLLPPPPPATARLHVPTPQPAPPSPTKQQPTALGLRFPPHPHAASSAPATSRPAAAAAAAGQAGGVGDGEDGQALVAMLRGIARALAAAGAAGQAEACGMGLPGVWVCKWVDYSKKYGLGYTLSNGSCGVFFNDATKMLLAPGMLLAQKEHLAWYAPRTEGASCVVCSSHRRSIKSRGAGHVGPCRHTPRPLVPLPLAGCNPPNERCSSSRWRTHPHRSSSSRWLVQSRGARPAASGSAARQADGHRLTQKLVRAPGYC
jgi:hypothetical protein